MILLCRSRATGMEENRRWTWQACSSNETLIGRELRGEKVEKPFVKYGQAALAKKGEDYFLIKPDCQRIPGNPSTSFSVFAVLFSSSFCFSSHT